MTTLVRLLAKNVAFIDFRDEKQSLRVRCLFFTFLAVKKSNIMTKKREFSIYGHYELHTSMWCDVLKKKKEENRDNWNSKIRAFDT